MSTSVAPILPRTGVAARQCGWRRGGGPHYYGRPVNLSAVLFALAIGLSLGLVGGGGSILTVPALVYAAGFEPKTAVTAALVVVGLTSLAAASLHWRLGSLDRRVAAWFGGVGAVGAWLGARLRSEIPAAWLMLVFAAIALAAGAMLLRGGTLVEARRRSQGVVVAAALGVGFLTGLLGVGGGFLIVPALVLAVGLEMRQAVGTSLAVIAFNCAAGYLASPRNLLRHEIWVVATFTALAVAGSLVGAWTGRRTRPAALRRVFALLVIGVGIYTGWRSWV